ncbi:WYL domain-containing protein [Streptantibioticus silvisoli]|uniref:WYL domain-containing protein n=1 Tax=Streptantibioticus silvisoli TaxID=2705255 RepID=A0ABT6W4V4_9ACTN|nr:WYL domain-containing protein [Streptantibioticus silvisoli]MDI5965783.1 WYL domain-containing protein [Streptantibioticus silvisoli]
MNRTLAAIRRTIRTALTADPCLVTAVRGYRHSLIVDLYQAIDTGTTVVISYRKASGEASRRAIRPLDLRVTAAGDIILRAHDLRDGDDTHFRIDRITNHQTLTSAVALAA